MNLRKRGMTGPGVGSAAIVVSGVVGGFEEALLSAA